MKDYATLLARYHFRDPHGHPLERCIDYLNLLKELELLRANNPGLVIESVGEEEFTGEWIEIPDEAPGQYSPEIEDAIKRNLESR